MTRLTRFLPPALMIGAIAMLSMHNVAHAQAFDEVAQNTSQRVTSGFSYIINGICFIGGSIFLIASIWGIYSHMKGNNNRPGVLLGSIVGLFLSGAMLSLPFIAKTASSTLFGSAPSVTGENQKMMFDK